MGKTSIEWCDLTWNPIRGCSRVSRGCEHCYAERQAARFTKKLVVIDEKGHHHIPPVERPGPFAGFVHSVNGHPAWTGKVELIEKHLLDPLHWRKPQRVFVNSISDLFHEALPDEAIDRVFAVMAITQHTYQVLTKRPEWTLRYLTSDANQMDTCMHEDVLVQRLYDVCSHGHSWPLKNVWLGVSVEDRENKRRIDLLRQVPAAIRFLSVEPLLEDIGELDLTGIHQVIVGGESGPRARPFDVQWARNILAQCKAAGVACFYKQGAASNACQHDRKGGHFECFPPDVQVRIFPHAV